MPGIISALAASGTPLSILTKGTLLRRDLPLIAEADEQVPVSVAVSLAVGEPELHKQVEPGTPGPQARLGLIAAIREAGLDCHVMVAPVLPYLTDSVEHLDGLLSQIAAAGAVSVTVFGLHLRGSTRGWFMSWLARTYPQLVEPVSRVVPARSVFAAVIPRRAPRDGCTADQPSTGWPATNGASMPPRRRKPSRRYSRRCSELVEVGCVVGVALVGVTGLVARQ